MAGILADRWPNINNHNGDMIPELGPGPVWDRPRSTNPIIQYILGGNDDSDEDEDEDEDEEKKDEEYFGDVESEDEGGGHDDSRKDGLVQDGDCCGGCDEPSDGSSGNENSDCDVMRELLRLDDAYCPLNFRACVHSLTRGPSTTEKVLGSHLAGRRTVVKVDEDTERTSTSNASQKARNKTVCFSSHVRVHHLVVWAFAHRAARHGPWEQAARDRKRFEQRIAEAEKTIAPCFGRPSVLPEAGQTPKTSEADRREAEEDEWMENTITCDAFCHRRPQSFPGIGKMLKMSDRGNGDFVERSGRKTEQQGGKKRLRSPPPLTLTLWD